MSCADTTNSAAKPMAKRLEGKVAIITGGASGIGESTARLFVKHGAIVIIADIQDQLGNSLCQELASSGTVSYIHCDVTSDSDVRQAVDMAVSEYGKLDIIFNNAGIPSLNFDVTTTENEDFKRVFDVNVFGAFLGAKHAARVMILARKGCILFNFSSSVITCLGELGHAYVASKNAVVGLAKNLCVELGQCGIRVNCISPFAVATPALRERLNMGKKETEELVSSSANLKGVMLEAEDVAEAALYLASDEAKYVSGANLLVDGGYSLVNPSFAWP